MGMAERVNARNSLEGYAYQVKNSLDDDKIKDKISEDDKETINEAVTETLDWLDENHGAEKKELEEVVNPIMKGLYEGAGGAPGGEDDDDFDDDFDDDDFEDHDEL